MLKAFNAGCGSSGNVRNKDSKQKNVPKENRLCKTSNARLWTRSALSRRTIVSRPLVNYAGRMCLHV